MKSCQWRAGLPDTHRTAPGFSQRGRDLSWGLGRLASILLPGQRAGAAIGSQALPRDLKCNPRRLKQQRDCSREVPLFRWVCICRFTPPPQSPETGESCLFLTRLVSGDSGRGIFDDRKVPWDSLRYLCGGLALEPGWVRVCSAELTVSSNGWSWEAEVH